jgi:hypothetical protein
MASYTYHEPGAGDKDFRLDPYLVIVTFEPLTLAARTWIEENTEPWQRQDGRLCVEHAVAEDILRRIVLSGLSYEGTSVDIPDELGAKERLLQERNWVRVMHQTMPQEVPLRYDAVTVIEEAMRHLGFLIQ